MKNLSLLDDLGRIESILLTYVDELDYIKIKSFLEQMDNSVSAIIAYDGVYVKVLGLSEGECGKPEDNNHSFDKVLELIKERKGRVDLLPLWGQVPKWPQDRL